MSHELLYTSAQNGLRSGSRGFTTVLCTQGMPSNLATRLETLSAYRHVFPPQDPRANHNPVGWSHLGIRVAGQTVSVLSRIAAYGVDYSGRTNKLAHHVAIASAQRPLAGPAWTLRQPGVMRQQWNGQCETPPSGPPIPSGDQAPQLCHQWANLTGDAGWAAVVAEAFASSGGKPLWIVCKLEQQPLLLPLLDEAIALLPAAKRWQATFSTYCTNLPPEVDCKVRCILAGSEEAKQAIGRGNVLNLAAPLPAAPVGALTVMARTGSSPAASVGSTTKHGGVAAVAKTSLAATASHVPSSSASPWDDGELQLEPPTVRGGYPGSSAQGWHGLPGHPAGPPVPFPEPSGSWRTSPWVLMSIVAAICLLIGTAAIVTLKLRSSGPTQAVADNSNNATEAVAGRPHSGRTIVIPSDHGQSEENIDLGRTEMQAEDDGASPSTETTKDESATDEHKATGSAETPTGDNVQVQDAGVPETENVDKEDANDANDVVQSESTGRKEMSPPAANGGQGTSTADTNDQSAESENGNPLPVERELLQIKLDLQRFFSESGNPGFEDVHVSTVRIRSRDIENFRFESESGGQGLNKLPNSPSREVSIAGYQVKTWGEEGDVVLRITAKLPWKGEAPEWLQGLVDLRESFNEHATNIDKGFSQALGLNLTGESNPPLNVNDVINNAAQAEQKIQVLRDLVEEELAKQTSQQDADNQVSANDGMNANSKFEEFKSQVGRIDASFLRLKGVVEKFKQSLATATVDLGKLSLYRQSNSALPIDADHRTPDETINVQLKLELIIPTISSTD